MNNSYYFDSHDDPFFINFNNPSPPPPSSHSDWNKRILYMAVISLSLVLFLVFALHIYARYVLRRHARRRVAIHRLSLTVAQSQNNTTSGLNPNIISTLPTFIFKRKRTRKNRENEEEHDDDDDSSIVECAVCLSTLEEGETLRLLPNCKHNFHIGCIDTWLASHSTCPICRTKVEPIVLRIIEPHPREGPIGIVVDDGSTPVITPPSLLFDQQIEGTSSSPSSSSNGSNNISTGASTKISNGGSVSNSISRLSSFRRILSRERSSRRIQPFSHGDVDDHDDVEHDLERQ